ncbi:MAG: hypothetical protein N2748_02715, partial [candidate division WOR-3 bacterium]|nr:hypothetical protein [candidate division WOR-3 bacterium]
YWAYNNDETDSVRIRIDASATEIIGQTIPNDTISIIGNLSAYKDTFQLLPRVWSDFYRPVFDVGATTILAPTGTIYQGSSVTPKVIVQNYGVATGQFPVVFEISTAKSGEYLDTAWVSLTAGQIDTVEFDSYHATALGEFTTNAWTALLGDANPANNSAPAGSFTVIERPASFWTQLASMPSDVAGKFVKDGGSLTATNDFVYAFRGNKSSEFYRYSIAGDSWSKMKPLPFTYKPNSTTINNKTVGKGAALCWDGGNYIYAIKGNSTYEFWKYDIANDSWIFRAWTPLPIKAGSGLTYNNGYVYLMIGGYDVDDETCIRRLSEVGDTWEDVTPRSQFIGKFKAGTAITALDSMLYVMYLEVKTNAIRK